jgi:hypothetical protein
VERVDRSHLARLLRLTLLAPDLVEAILDGRHPEQMTLAALRRRAGGMGGAADRPDRQRVNPGSATIGVVGYGR